MVAKGVLVVRCFGGRVGIAAPSFVFAVTRYAYPHVAPISAMRSDWNRIGGDFAVAIAKADQDLRDDRHNS